MATRDWQYTYIPATPIPEYSNKKKKKTPAQVVDPAAVAPSVPIKNAQPYGGGVFNSQQIPEPPDKPYVPTYPANPQEWKPVVYPQSDGLSPAEWLRKPKSVGEFISAFNPVELYRSSLYGELQGPPPPPTQPMDIGRRIWNAAKAQVPPQQAAGIKQLGSDVYNYFTGKQNPAAALGTPPRQFDLGQVWNPTEAQLSQPGPAPINPVTQAQAGSSIATPSSGTASKAKTPIADPNSVNSRIPATGRTTNMPGKNASTPLQIAAGRIPAQTNPYASLNPASGTAIPGNPFNMPSAGLNTGQSYGMEDAYGTSPSMSRQGQGVVMSGQGGEYPQVTPELTAGSQAAAELDAPKNWMQKLASPQGRDFIAMIGQMLAAKGSTYGNEPPASLGYATAARGVTQQALANDWSTRLYANPNAKAPSTLSAESQKQVMDIHEHKAVNEERKYKRQMDMQQIELQKQHLDAQAKKDEADYKFNEEKLKIDKMLADQKINESQADSLYRAAQARALEADIGLTRARTALVGEPVSAEKSGGGSGGLTAYQIQMEQNRDEAALGRIMAETGITDPWEAMQELNNRKAALQGKPAPSVLPAQQGANPAAAAPQTVPITPAQIQAAIKANPNDPLLAELLKRFPTGINMPITHGLYKYFGGK